MSHVERLLPVDDRLCWRNVPAKPRRKSGTGPQARAHAGFRAPHARLTWEQVCEIRAWQARGISYAECHRKAIGLGWNVRDGSLFGILRGYNRQYR